LFTEVKSLVLQILACYMFCCKYSSNIERSSCTFHCCHFVWLNLHSVYCTWIRWFGRLFVCMSMFFTYLLCHSGPVHVWGWTWRQTRERRFLRIHSAGKYLDLVMSVMRYQ